MIGLTGLFSRKPKDPMQKRNIAKIKEFKRLVRAKKYDLAIKSGTEYLSEVPHNPDILFTMGGIYYMRNKHRTAISYFDRAVGIASYDVDVLILKAYSHKKLNEKQKAIECCSKILEIDPKNEDILELLAELS